MDIFFFFNFMFFFTNIKIISETLFFLKYIYIYKIVLNNPGENKIQKIRKYSEIFPEPKLNNTKI